MEITISAIIKLDIERVWQLWNDPKHIVNWNSASEDWHTTKATNDLMKDGKFNYRMEAKDQSFGFDFSGTYTKIIDNELIEILLDDNRKVKVSFSKDTGETKIVQTFEAENKNEAELQRTGWQSILNNFKKYCEK